MQGTQQDTTSKRRMVDGKFQMLLLAFAAAPALAELHVQLPDHLAVASQSLVSVSTIAVDSRSCPRACYSQSCGTSKCGSCSYIRESGCCRSMSSYCTASPSCTFMVSAPL